MHACRHKWQLHMPGILTLTTNRILFVPSGWQQQIEETINEEDSDSDESSTFDGQLPANHSIK